MVYKIKKFSTCVNFWIWYGDREVSVICFKRIILLEIFKFFVGLIMEGTIV